MAHACYSSYDGKQSRLAGHKCETLFEKYLKTKMARTVAQVVEQLPGKLKAPSFKK
jgi:hypothetical protein